MRMVLCYAFLAVGLLLDGASLFRMALLCAVLHETGHVVVYCFCAKKLPRLRLSAGGISLQKDKALCRGQELAVLAAGPLVNFLLAGALLCQAQGKASYAVYFLAAVSLCVGIYNLLPFGVLDGAHMLQLLVPAHRLAGLLRLQQRLLVVFCVLVPLCALFAGASGTLRVAALIAPLYLLLQNTFS